MAYYFIVDQAEKLKMELTIFNYMKDYRSKS